jgi:hypothetical protein
MHARCHVLCTVRFIRLSRSPSSHRKKMSVADSDASLPCSSSRTAGVHSPQSAKTPPSSHVRIDDNLSSCRTSSIVAPLPEQSLGCKRPCSSSAGFSSWMSVLAPVECQLVLRFLDIRARLATARCNEQLFEAASQPFACPQEQLAALPVENDAAVLQSLGARVRGSCCGCRPSTSASRCHPESEQRAGHRVSKLERKDGQCSPGGGTGRRSGCRTRCKFFFFYFCHAT